MPQKKLLPSGKKLKTRKLVKNKITNLIKSLYVQCAPYRFHPLPKRVYAGFELDADAQIEEITTISLKEKVSHV